MRTICIYECSVAICKFNWTALLIALDWNCLKRNTEIHIHSLVVHLYPHFHFAPPFVHHFGSQPFDSIRVCSVRLRNSARWMREPINYSAVPSDAFVCTRAHTHTHKLTHKLIHCICLHCIAFHQVCIAILCKWQSNAKGSAQIGPRSVPIHWFILFVHFVSVFSFNSRAFDCRTRPVMFSGVTRWRGAFAHLFCLISVE